MKKIITSIGSIYTHKGYYVYPQGNCYQIVNSKNESVMYRRTLKDCVSYINNLVNIKKALTSNDNYFTIEAHDEDFMKNTTNMYKGIVYDFNRKYVILRDNKDFVNINMDDIIRIWDNYNKQLY